MTLVRTAPSASAVRGWIARNVLVVAAVLAIAAIVLARLHEPRPVTATTRSQLQALLRVGLTVVLATTLLVGPGLVLRVRIGALARMPLGFVPVPGVLLLSLIGGLAWWLHDVIDQRAVVQAALVVASALVGWGSRGSGPLVTLPERRVLWLAAAVLLVALGRSLWSLGPAGELYAGTISRTLEVGDRPDSRISYHVTTLVTHGLGAYSSAGAALFDPYGFSDRGPLPGLTASPVMLASGTQASAGLPDQQWSLFDPTGFMVYRIVMILLALTALLAVHSVARAAFGERVAWLSALVVAGTPFYVHDVYFTWPKWAAAAGVLLAACLLLVPQRRNAAAVAAAGGAGLCVAFGFLMHPLALLGLLPLAALTVLVGWREGGGGRIPRLWDVAARVVPRGLALGVGALVPWLVWRLVNGPHFSQGGFLNYFRIANDHQVTGPAQWLHERWLSLLNTIVPLRVPIAEADNPSLNSIYQHSDGVVHFFFQYWVGFPFGCAIVFYPALLWGLAVSLRQRPWTVALVGLLPVLFFVVYWGSYRTGLLREGLHASVLALLILWSAALAPRLADGSGLPRWLRAVLVCRPLEILAMIMVPTWWAHRGVTAAGFRAGDLVALASMAAGLAVLVAITAAGTSARAFDRLAAEGAGPVRPR